MSNPHSGSGNNKTQKRNLPSWMSSSESEKKKDAGKSEDDEKTEHSKRSAASGSSASDFSKLLEGVVFVLSGFVNPERSTLRSKAIEMGAAYQADWNSDCTLLVCAFPNTPKFRQVEADCGTIVSKEWILECYNQKKLVDINNYLMHAGKPWRKSSVPHQTSQEESPSRRSQKGERGSQSKPTPSSSSKKSTASNFAKEKFSPTELKKWAADDLIKTISWLESQEEKPEQSEIKQIAAEGILTCLQDAIDSLEQKQDVRHITEQWQCVPRVVEELAKLVVSEKGSGSHLKEDLCTQAKTWKRIYYEELHRLDSDTPTKKKKPKTDKHGSGNNGRPKATKSDAAGSDSEETIEMTEEEIELAYQNVTS